VRPLAKPFSSSLNVNCKLIKSRKYGDGSTLCKSSHSSVSIVFPSHKKGRNTTVRLKYSFNGDKNVAAGRSSRVEKDCLAGILLSFVFHRR